MSNPDIYTLAKRLIEECDRTPGLPCVMYANPHDIVAAIEEIAALRAKLANLDSHAMDLRRHRIEFDCRYTLGDVADSGGRHCPLDKPCQRCELEDVTEAAGSLDAAMSAIGGGPDTPEFHKTIQAARRKLREVIDR